MLASAPTLFLLQATQVIIGTKTIIRQSRWPALSFFRNWSRLVHFCSFDSKLSGSLCENRALTTHCGTRVSSCAPTHIQSNKLFIIIFSVSVDSIVWSSFTLASVPVRFSVQHFTRTTRRHSTLVTYLMPLPYASAVYLLLLLPPPLLPILQAICVCI